MDSIFHRCADKNVPEYDLIDLCVPGYRLRSLDGLFSWVNGTDIPYFCISGRDQIASSQSQRRTVQTNLSTACSSTLPIIPYLSSTTCWNGFQSAIRNAWKCSPAAEVQCLWCRRLVSVCRSRLHVPLMGFKDTCKAIFSFQTTLWTRTGPAGV